MNKKRYIAIFVFIVLVIGVFLYINLFNFEKVKLDVSEDELGINENEINEVIKKYQKPEVVYATLEESETSDEIVLDNVVNIALFGVDGRSEQEKGVRADSIMIATIDSNNNKLKLTSLMRDQYVNIEGYGKDKLNHAYAFGGPTLMIKTINENFGLNITDYTTVNFFSFQKIIDRLGGIEVDLTSDELRLLNKHAGEVARLQNMNYIPLQELNGAHLDGLQTVAYSRIRMTGNGDLERAERQREVLDKLFEKVKNQSVLQTIDLWSEISSNIQTSLSDLEIAKYMNQVWKMKDKTIYQNRYPQDGTWKGFRDKKGVWYMDVDIESQKENFINWIYVE